MRALCRCGAAWIATDGLCAGHTDGHGVQVWGLMTKQMATDACLIGTGMQVTSSSDLLQWSPFELLSISGLDLTIPAAAAEVYFIHVQTNPVHRRTLLGVMPIVHRGLGCLALALSTDGKRWSRPTPLKRCEVPRIWLRIGYGWRCVRQAH